MPQTSSLMIHNPHINALVHLILQIGSLIVMLSAVTPIFSDLQDVKSCSVPVSLANDSTKWLTQTELLGRTQSVRFIRIDAGTAFTSAKFIAECTNLGIKSTMPKLAAPSSIMHMPMLSTLLMSVQQRMSLASMEFQQFHINSATNTSPPVLALVSLVAQPSSNATNRCSATQSLPLSNNVDVLPVVSSLDSLKTPQAGLFILPINLKALLSHATPTLTKTSTLPYVLIQSPLLEQSLFAPTLILMASATIMQTLNLPLFTKLAQPLTSVILYQIFSMHQNLQSQVLMTLLMMITQHSFIMAPHHPHHIKSTVLATDNTSITK